ncbi:uncharacterized protein RJT21DRAFT_115290 [Scheffersomyces amazonensis]|uniref:uncharacterized protein n=1 Tax=Scheffersomyces amazonensis TaxID=1078765 RepID=UPI00315DEB52
MTFWKRLTKSNDNPPPYEEKLGKAGATEKDSESPTSASAEKDNKSQKKVAQKKVKDGKDLERKCALYFADLDNLSTDVSTLNSWQRVLNRVYSEAEGLERLSYNYGVEPAIVYRGKDYGNISFSFFNQFSYRLVARLAPKLGVVIGTIYRNSSCFNLFVIQNFIANNSALLEPDLKARVQGKGL